MTTPNTSTTTAVSDARTAGRVLEGLAATEWSPRTRRAGATGSGTRASPTDAVTRIDPRGTMGSRGSMAVGQASAHAGMSAVVDGAAV